MIALAWEVVAAIASHDISEQIIKGLNDEIAQTQEREKNLITLTDRLDLSNKKFEGKFSEQELSLRELGIRSVAFEKSVKEQRTRDDATLSILKKDAADLEDAQKNAIASAGKAQNAASAASEAAANMEKTLLSEQDMRDKMHDLTTDRTICISCVTEKLKSFGKIPFVFIVADASESVVLTSHIATALENAGWDWKPWDSSDHAPHFGVNIIGKPFMLTHNSLRGISIEIANVDIKTLKKPGEALFAALQSEGLKNMHWREISDADMKIETKIYGVIHIYVGAKQ